jgi:glycosyltransferase involved in cell wall biosynthesis
MRVAIDARELCGRPTGVGRYLAGLLDAWSRGDAARRHEWMLFAPRAIEAAARWRASVKVAAGSGGTKWEQLTLPRAVASVKPDVFFAPGYTAPLTVAAPLVLTIHDLSFFAHPEWFSFREGARRRWLTAWSARRAKAVITDTEFSKAEIARYIGIPDARTIPLGITTDRSSDRSNDRPNDRLNDRLNDRGAIVLFVGSLFQRRRVDRLIQAFDLVADRVSDAQLEIVGENRTQPVVDFDSIRRGCRHGERISIRSYVDDAALSSLYRRASVFAFLSEYEGFGLTPLEALADGLPPLVLDTAVARETCGAAARYVALSASNEEIAGALEDLLTNPAARQAVLGHRQEVLARYDWDVAARATLAVLEEAAGGR